jgi:large subunit ribosomal protein L17
MRHQVRGRKLGRTASHRKATMRALSTALIKNQRIVTTVAKAKELRRYIEPVITRALKEDSPHNRRQIFSFLNDKTAVTTLYDEIVPAVGDRPGGYTRVIKLGNRAGDGAPTALIELVDFNDVKPEGQGSGKKKRTRRAGRKKSAAAEEEAKPKAEKKQEAKAEPKAKAAAAETAEAEKKEAKAAKAEEAAAEAADNKPEADSADSDKSSEEKKSDS